MIRQLNVYLEQQLIGQILEQSGMWGFQYTPEWLRICRGLAVIKGLALTVEIHWDSATSRPVQWFFDNLLPEETARALLAKDTRVKAGDTFALLMAIGAESAGAITLLPPGQRLATADATPVTPAELNSRILNLPQAPLNQRQRKRMSLAGAQHKMLVIFHNGQLLEPSGQMPSTHILKPEHSQPDIYPFTCRNEWFVMTLAGHCGLPVPSVDIIYVPQAAYIVKRFDRSGDYPHHSRLHMMDGCQLLGIPAADKYRASDAQHLLQLSEPCLRQGVTRLAMLRWAIFNALVGNGDAHLKNLSFNISLDGVELMPHYDLLSTIIYADVGKHMNENLSQPMGNAVTYGELTQADVLAFSRELNIAPNLAKRELQQLLRDVPVHAAKLLQEVHNLPPHSGTPGELRVLRQICSLAIDEMIMRLA